MKVADKSPEFYNYYKQSVVVQRATDMRSFVPGRAAEDPSPKMFTLLILGQRIILTIGDLSFAIGV